MTINDGCELCGEVSCAGREAHYYVCEVCKGSGGWDYATDIEVYDDWHDCDTCAGLGEIEA